MSSQVIVSGVSSAAKKRTPDRSLRAKSYFNDEKCKQ